MRFLAVIVFSLILSLALAQFDSDYRAWYVGGNYTHLNNKNGQSVHVNNIAQYDGNTWTPMGPSANPGVNGQVNKVYTDLCKNVYVAGHFTKAGEVTTGPATVYYWKSKTWTAIGTAALTWSAGSYINDISVDCFNLPSGVSSCPCDVWLAGNFVATIGTGGLVATNIIKYDASSNTWDNLGGVAAHGMTLEATGVFKKASGVTGATAITYVVGRFPSTFQKYHKDTKKWGYSTGASIGTITGTINAVSYGAFFTINDNVYFGGKFTWTQGAVTCVNTCTMDWETEKISLAGTADVPDNTVNAIEYIDSTLYVGGTFTGRAKRVVYPFNNNPFSAIQAGQDNFTTPAIRYINVITNSNPLSDSATGSANFIGMGGFATYYSKKNGKYTPFLGLTQGEFRAVATAYNPFVSGAVSKFGGFAVVLVAVVCSVLLM
jgi:hypothetical protein